MKEKKPKMFPPTPWGALCLFEALSKIGNARNPKIELLKANSKNPYLKELLGWTYSSLKFYAHFTDVEEILKTKKIRAPQDETGEANYADFRQLLMDLSSRRLTGGKALQAIESFFKKPHLYEKEARWYARVMAHDLDIGVRRGVIEQIWPKFYHVKAEAGSGKPVFKGQQKCPTAIIDVDADLPYPIRAEWKEDGFRATFVSDGGNCVGFTTGGKTYPPMTIFSELFKEYPGAWSAELFYINYNKSAIFRRTKPLTPEDMKDIRKKATCHIVDYVPLKDYYKGRSSKSYRKRMKFGKKILKKIGNGNVTWMPGRTVHDRDELSALLKKALRKKLEGLVTKDLRGGYVPGRCDDWRKLKPTKDRTVVVIGVEEGDTARWKGMLGAFVCKDPKTKKIFNCGGSYKDPVTGESSLTHKERKRLWKIRGKLIGRKIEVIEQDEQKGDRKSMYARFKGFRNDAE